jgi:hypothetical protein
MLYCQSGPADHRSPAAQAATFARVCGHEYPSALLVCPQHAAELRARPRASDETACERCHRRAALVVVGMEDVFEERVTVTVLRPTLDLSAHSPVTFAYDRAYRMATERGLRPVTGYRLPVTWNSREPLLTPGTDLLEAHVTLAVTRPRVPASRAG